MIFGINTTSDNSKLLYVSSRAVRRVKFETILKYHKWYLCQYHVQIRLLFVYTTTHKRFVIFICSYFKLSWNTTALSQSNCRNFSCGSIMTEIFRAPNQKGDATFQEWHIFTKLDRTWRNWRPHELLSKEKWATSNSNGGLHVSRLFSLLP